MSNARSDDRTHYYIARCDACPKWIHHCPQAPIKADRLANRHARKEPGHEAYVIDLDKLEVKYRYRFDALETDSEIPF